MISQPAFFGSLRKCDKGRLRRKQISMYKPVVSTNENQAGHGSAYAPDISMKVLVGKMPLLIELSGQLIENHLLRLWQFGLLRHEYIENQKHLDTHPVLGHPVGHHPYPAFRGG